jgi:hypothetical protein
VSTSEIRADQVSALSELSAVIPEMRFGQLVAAVGELCTDQHGRGLFDADDEELLEAVWQFRRNYERTATPSHEGA